MSVPNSVDLYMKNGFLRTTADNVRLAAPEEDVTVQERLPELLANFSGAGSHYMHCPDYDHMEALPVTYGLGQDNGESVNYMEAVVPSDGFVVVGLCFRSGGRCYLNVNGIRLREAPYLASETVIFEPVAVRKGDVVRAGRLGTGNGFTSDFWAHSVYPNDTFVRFFPYRTIANASSGMTTPLDITVTELKSGEGSLEVDGGRIHVGLPAGEEGLATITLGSITQLPKGAAPTISNGGTSRNAVLNLALPPLAKANLLANADWNRPHEYEVHYETTTSAPVSPGSSYLRGVITAVEDSVIIAQNASTSSISWTFILVNGVIMFSIHTLYRKSALNVYAQAGDQVEILTVSDPTPRPTLTGYPLL